MEILVMEQEKNAEGGIWHGGFKKEYSHVPSGKAGGKSDYPGGGF